MSVLMLKWSRILFKEGIRVEKTNIKVQKKQSLKLSSKTASETKYANDSEWEADKTERKKKGRERKAHNALIIQHWEQG